MERNPKNDREQAHDLLDLLPDDKIPAVRTLLEAMIEPIARSLASTVVDHEEPTPETIAAIKKGRSSLARGEGVPHEDVLREFGFKK